jgi:hypothetical protein
MSKSDIQYDDILKHHIDTGRIEKAPDGFTDGVMTRIRVETEPSEIKEHFHKRISIPLIAVITVIVLLSLTIIIPANNTEPTAFIKVMQYFRLQVDKLNFVSFPTLNNIPGWIPWFFVGVLLLVLFDLAISGLFRREKQ